MGSDNSLSKDRSKHRLTFSLCVCVLSLSDSTDAVEGESKVEGEGEDEDDQEYEVVDDTEASSNKGTLGIVILGREGVEMWVIPLLSLKPFSTLFLTYSHINPFLSLKPFSTLFLTYSHINPFTRSSFNIFFKI